MLDELFNEEYLREQYDKAIATKERQEGRREGVITTLIKLVKEGLLTVSQAAVRAKVTEPEFEKMLAAYGEGATTA
ncbi:MAG: resolvase [Clostridia bacterium]|nr:resolvase [Clostridia bacterium]